MYGINNVHLFNAIAAVVLFFLTGVLVSLMVFRFRTFKKGEIGFLSSIGILLGIAAPWCVVCGVGLLSLLGFSSFLLILPFKGSEIIVLANFLMIFSIYGILGKLYNPVCEVKYMENSNNVKGGKIGRKK